ncbi:hypothetical protein AB0D49_19865 [Streptomyces sp. NPDC048290]|uniref:hypothetical protein n=1 Tax=Streptomyces sp. NPDC048290 TaxID=3155811 RepID=UPI00341D2FE5
MSLSLSSRAPSGPRRRTLLVSAAGTLLLTGCSGDGDGDGGTGDAPAAADRARARAARESLALAGRYDAVIAAHPPLAGRLGPLRAEVVQHARAFGGAPAPSGSPSTAPVPADQRAALTALAAAERTLADRRTRELLDLPGELARLLASVAAAGAAHAFVLGEGLAEAVVEEVEEGDGG